MYRFVVASLALTIAAVAAEPLAQPPPNLSLPVTQDVTPAALQAYGHAAEREVRGDILPFWLAHARDEKRGGFVGYISQDMTVRPNAPRGVLLTSRILWTFSTAYRRFGDPAYLEMAKWAYRDLVDRGFDPKDGGVFWTVAPDGKPVVANKILYGQSFAIYALAEYYRATHDQAALDRAVALYRLVEDKTRDHKNGGYFEAFTRDWKRSDTLLHHAMGGEGAKSQNTHIHLLEAYTNLLRAWPDPKLREDFRSLLELMLTRIIDQKTHHLVLFFRDDWTPVGDEISFGHDIELSWLVVEAANVLGDKDLIARAQHTAIEMADTTVAQGIDRDGSVLNEANPHGLTDDNKDWWPQAEATVGFLNAYQISHQPKYFADSLRAWDFIQATMIDRKYGDWYESVTRDGKVRPRAKLSVWKCPYHNSRACFEIMDRVEELEKTAK